MFRLVLLLCLLITSCATFKNRPAQTHIVRKGDTLFSLARDYGVSLDALLDANRLQRSDTLRVGQRLQIPSSSSTKRRLPQEFAAPTPKNDPYPNATIALLYPVKEGVLFRRFDETPTRLYEGIGIGAPPNTPVMAAQDGTIVYVGDDWSTYGKVIIIKHIEPFTTVYAHLDSITVRQNDTVKKGQAIGTVGTTGNAESPCVYFQVRKDRTPVDPEVYLPNQG